MLVCGLKARIVSLKLLEQMSQAGSVGVDLLTQTYAAIKMLRETRNVGEVNEY
jgi:hypothetical protein